MAAVLAATICLRRLFEFGDAGPGTTGITAIITNSVTSAPEFSKIAGITGGLVFVNLAGPESPGLCF